LYLPFGSSRKSVVAPRDIAGTSLLGMSRHGPAVATGWRPLAKSRGAGEMTVVHEGEADSESKAVAVDLQNVVTIAVDLHPGGMTVHAVAVVEITAGMTGVRS